jgi:putative tryptophan/tyrosine transport system substrate-binding protein
MITRRACIGTLAGSLLMAPLVVEAQQPRIARIAILHMVAPGASPSFGAFRDALRDLGYVDGENIVVEYHWPQNRPERLTALAADLVWRKVDVIVAGDPTAALAARRATAQIPIVVAVFAIDPVAAGLVSSLAHPGANVTGFSVMAPEVTTKRLELLRDVVPRLHRVAVLWSPQALQHADLLRETDQAARQLGLEITRIAATTAGELDRAFQAALRELWNRLLGGQCLSMAAYVTVTGAETGPPPPEGRSCCLRSPCVVAGARYHLPANRSLEFRFEIKT